MLSANDLLLVNETLEGLKGRLKAWNRVLESKGLRLTKMMISRENARKVTMENRFPCAVSEGCRH